MKICIENLAPVKILTKCAENTIDLFIGPKGIQSTDMPCQTFFNEFKHLIAIGFTLTGHDELEPNASTNAERIEAMRKLHEAGFKTFASIEPIIDFESSRKMIEQTLPFCDLYKIGLESGKKYKIEDIHLFLHQVSIMTRAWQNKLYFKDSILTAAKIKREQLHPDNCVNRDYNIFTNQ
jgi:DNA repair photolyase